MESEIRAAGHLDGGDLAAYVDRTLSAGDRRRIEAHLGDCAECRCEMVAVARIVRGSSRRVKWLAPAGLAAAAAVVLLFAGLWRQSPPATRFEPVFREPDIASIAAPAAIAPRGALGTVRSFVWSRVAVADHYRVTVIDASGSVLWETQTADTSAVTPFALRLRPGATYFWKVEAQTRWDRWVASELVEFSIARPKS